MSALAKFGPLFAALAAPLAPPRALPRGAPPAHDTVRHQRKAYARAARKRAKASKRRNRR